MKNQNLAHFLFEAATLKRLQRTGWQILGGNEESIAEHSYMVAVISFMITKGEKADLEKVLLMALFHDFAEARTGDIYKLADLYVEVDEKKAVEDAFSGLAFGKDLVNIVREYGEKKTLEAKIVHDADTLALSVELKQMMEKGDLEAKEWYNANFDRLKLVQSKAIAKELEKTSSQDWWKKEREKIHKGFGK